MEILQKGKIGSITTLLVVSIIFLAGCTTTYLELKSWEGRTINDLYFEWGKADEVGPSNKPSGRVHTWYFDRTVDGEVKTCKKSFYTRYDGRAEVIVDTKYSDCLFLTAK
jgi:hypothetical protein